MVSCERRLDTVLRGSRAGGICNTQSRFWVAFPLGLEADQQPGLSLRASAWLDRVKDHRHPNARPEGQRCGWGRRRLGARSQTHLLVQR